MMKRNLVLAAVICLVLFTVPAVLAETTDAEAQTQIILQDVPDRMIEPVDADEAGLMPANPVIEGESPVTGLPWSGRYLPMMVMINTSSGGVGKITPWGTQYADVTYETLHTRDGVTRCVMVFNDYIPDSVGPVRSVRNSAIKVHSEWWAGFVFWGGPKVTNNNIIVFFNETGARGKGILFDGVGVASNVPPQSLWSRLDGVYTTANLNVNLAGIRDLIAEDYVAPARPFLFTDERLYDDRENAEHLSLDYGSGGNVSHFDYDAETDSYTRSVEYEGETVLYQAYTSGADRQTLNQDELVVLRYQNVIIQRVEYTFANGNGSMPLMDAIGSGNADIFIGGHYIAGYWVRTDLDSPTYYFDEYGNQIELTRGKTFIALMPGSALLSYEAAQ